MAAPDSKGILDMTGTWVLNRQLSDDIDPTFAVQGVPWVLRKVLSFAGVSLDMDQSSCPPEEGADGSGPVISIRVKQTVTPGGFNNEDTYVLDGEAREAKVPIFGAITMRARYTTLEDLEDAELEHKLTDGGRATVAIQELVTSKTNGWSSVGIWGFEEVDGKRRFTRTNVTNRDDIKVVARLVYDYKAE